MKRKLLLACCALLLGWSNASAQTEWTGDITNADGLSFTTKYADPSNHDVAETWTGTSSPTHAFDVNQSLTGVPDGVYELSAQAMYRASLTYGTTTNCVLYATVGETTFSTPIANFADYTANEDRAQIGTQMQNNNAYLNVVPAVMVEGGNVKIGMKNIGELAFCTNGYWFVYKKSTFTFKNVTATYHAKLVARATTMLATAPESDYKTALSNALTTYADATYSNVKALQSAINTFLATATETNPLNVTDYIKNPSFSDDSGNKKNWIQDLGYKQPDDIYQPTGWNMLYSSAKVNNAADQTYKTQTDGAKDNNCYYVRHRWGDVYAKVSLHQLVKELPAGKYQLTVAVKGGSSVTDPNSLSMKAGSKSGTTEVSDFDKSNYKDYSVQVTKVNADDDIDISFGWDQKSDVEQLYYVDDFRLYYLGDPVPGLKKELEDLQASIDDDYLNNATYTNVVGSERTNLISAKTITAAEETAVAYQDAIDEVDEAINTFTAAKTNYDVLVVEIAKAKALGIDGATADGYAATSSSTAASALGSTQNLMVAEYNYATENYATPIALGEWNETGTNTMPADWNNEHWSGTAVTYKNQLDDWGDTKKGYPATSWSMGLNQDITLPAGDYIFKVAGRKSADATMTLTVTNKATSAILGTIADFPSGNNTKGINTSGATDFATGEGHTYANGGSGFGWQWRYVPFSLNKETTVNIAVEAGTTKLYNWASFGDYAVWSKPNVAASTIAYNKAVEDAGTAKTTYPQVTGTELTELNDALDADKGSTVETIDAATAVIKTKTSALIAAAPSYDAYLLAKGYGEAINSTLLPYASTAKLTAVTEALETSVTSAATAVTATTAINTANRAAYESNMNAEGVVGATNRTSLIKNADGNNTEGWSGSFGKMSNEPYTDASGSSTNTYFDTNGIKSFTSSQTIKLVAGTYILSVTARAQANIDSYKLKVENSSGDEESVNLTAMGNANGVFNRGWNVATVEFTQKAFGDATISIVADNTESNADFWMSWDRFRLVSIAEEGKYEISEDVNAAISNYSDVDVTLTRTIKADTWNTFVVPFAINNTDLKAAFGNDVAIAEYSETADGDNSDIAFNTMATPAVAANTPVLLKTSTAGTSYTFTERNIVEGEAKVEGENYDFVGSYKASITLVDGDYFISSNKLYKNEGATVTLKGTRAYIKAKGTPNNVKILNFVIGDGSATGIEAPEVTEAEEEKILYNTAGVRVGKDYKGIVINQKGEKRLQK